MYRTAMFLSFVLLFGACSNPAKPTTTVPTSNIATSTETQSTTTTSVQTATTSEPTTTTVATTTRSTTAVAGSTSTTLAGEPFDLGPQAGDILGVVGVAFDDVLNVRSGPGTDRPIVARLEPLYDNIVATGEHRILTKSIWNQVKVDGKTGWANTSYMAYLGAVDDATSRYVANAFNGVIPTAATMLELGMLVADAASSDDPPSRVTVTVAPTFGDPAEITIDIIGLGDDAVFGVRIHIFGQPISGGFSLKSIEEQVLCGRGITTEGLCP